MIDEKAFEYAKFTYVAAGGESDEHLRTAITGYLQALSPGSTGETDGWVLVPVEPTEAMLVAVTADLRGADHMPGSYDLTDADWAKRFYRAMLAAAGGRDE